MSRISIITAAALLLATPAFAQGDAPGGGPTGTKTAKPTTGEEVFGQVCAACHMADAKGATGAATIPALASNPKLGAAAYPIYVVVNGKGVMPPFDHSLSPAQIAAAITYVRTHFGNNYPKPVTEADVTKMMAAKAGH